MKEYEPGDSLFGMMRRSAYEAQKKAKEPVGDIISVLDEEVWERWLEELKEKADEEPAPENDNDSVPVRYEIETYRTVIDHQDCACKEHLKKRNWYVRLWDWIRRQ